MPEGEVEAAGPRAQRASAVERETRPTPFAASAPAAVAADDRVVDPEALEQPERLGEVARGDLHLVPLRAQDLDDRAQHEHVRAVREVDPDAHPRRRLWPVARGGGVRRDGHR